MILTTGGLDIQFKFQPQVGADLVISTNTYARQIWTEEERDLSTIKIGLATRTELDGDYYDIVIANLVGVVEVEKAHIDLGIKAPVYEETTLFPLDFRIFYLDSYLAITINGRWGYFYGFGSTRYQDLHPVVTMAAEGSNLNVTDIIIAELKDGRQAIYVDYESTADNALQSIIQVRPIQPIAEVGRELSFTYRTERDSLTASFIQSYTEEIIDPPNAASDALVYYADVGISLSELTAEQIGLITKLYRLSELNAGAIEAAAMMQLIAIEERNTITIVQRFDERIQIRDVLNIDLFVAGTNRHIQDQIIISDLSFNLEDGKYSMKITGRRKKYA